MEWITIYQTVPGNYDAITALLKSHELLCEVFLDPLPIPSSDALS